MNLHVPFRPVDAANAVHTGEFCEPPASVRARLLLAMVCLFPCAIALLWAFTTPLLQQNDELGHLDYVFALQDAGYNARMTGPVRFVATAQGRYLAKALDYRRLKYNFASKAPAGYGSGWYVRGVDAGAPTRLGLDPKAGLPYVGFAYPEPYYVVLAELMSMRAAIFGPGIYEDAMIGRLIDGLFLAVTLLGAYLGLRALGMARLPGIVATGAAGTLPVVSIVFSSVQPDVATTAFVTLAIAFALRATSGRNGHRDFWCVVASTVALAFVKPLYAAVLALSLISVSAIRVWRGVHIVVWCAVGECVIAASVAFARTLVIASPFGNPFTPLSSNVVIAIEKSLADIYAGGPAFMGFWYREGIWFSRPLATGSVLASIRSALFSFEVIVVIFVLSAMYRTLRSAMMRRTSIRALFDGNAQALVLATVYIAWTGFLVLADVSMNNTFGLLGRYWIPMLLPLLAAVTYYAPAAFVRGAAIDRARLCSASAFLAFTLFLSVLAYRSEYERFYGTTPGADRSDKFISVTSVRIGSQANCNCFDPEVIRGQPVSIAGSGLDSDAGLPGRGAYFTIDGRRVVRAYYGAPRGSQIVSPLFDDAMHDIAFDGTIQTRNLSYGKHVVRIYIECASGVGAKEWPRTLTLTVAQRPHIL